MTSAATPSRAGGSTLDDVERELAGHGLQLLRAWPRDENHLLLEAARGASAVAGQWFASVQRAAEVTRKTRGAEQLGRVVLQPGGADRRLPGLRTLLEREGAELVAHRPERRAVVRLPASQPGSVTYAKVLRPTVLAAVARTTRAAADLPVRTPAVLQVDEEAAAVLTAALPGRTLHDLLDSSAAVAACRTAGRALAQLHRAPVPSWLPRHEDGDERAVVRRWQQLAEVHGLAPAFALPAATAADATPPDDDEDEDPVLIHRDFHDKQVVVDDDGEVGVLDFDLMALGSPSVDLANLLVHLDLRVLQGLVSDAGPLRAAVLDGYGATDAQVGRLARYERGTWQRLAAVYAFRPPRSVS